MQWACNNIPCECTFNMTYKLGAGDSTVHASVTLDNHRSDQTEYGFYDQEFPAVYVNGFLYRLYTYTGDAPWTNQPMEEINVGFENNFWVPGKVNCTESFAILANDDGFGVGVYNAGADVDAILLGFFGEKGSGGTSDSATGYMAPTGTLSLQWNEVYTYEYVLMMGNIDQIRSKFYTLHQEE